MRTIAFLFSVVLFQFLPLVGIAYGQKTPEVTDFRIDSDIYDDERKPPLYSIQTIFCAGQYIELDDKNGRVTVVDPGKGRVTILDSKQKALVHLEMQALENQLNHVLEGLTPAQQKKFMWNGTPAVGVGWRDGAKLVSKPLIAYGNKIVSFKVGYAVAFKLLLLSWGHTF